MNRRFAYVALVVAGASTSALIFTGCGDDSASPSPSGDGSVEASGPDATTEAGQDSGADQSTTGDSTVDAGSDGSVRDRWRWGKRRGRRRMCTPFDASGLDDASVQAGMMALWTVYKCQGCHQKSSQKVDDAGNGLVLSGNNDGLGDSGLVFPPNLTNDPATGLGCWTDMQVVTAILNGKDNAGKSLCPSMPHWGDPLQLPMDGGPRPGTPMDAGTAKEIVDSCAACRRSTTWLNRRCARCRSQDAGDAATGAGDASDAGAADAAVTDADAGAGDDAAAADAGDGATD